MPYFFDQLFADRKRFTALSFILSVGAFVFSAAPVSAGTGDFTVGYEAQLYRPGVSPEVFHILSVGGNYADKNPDSETQIDFSFSFNPQEIRVWAIRGENIYWSIKAGEKLKGGGKRFSLSLGRKSMEWNELDTDWNLSLIQPIDQWDRFRPAQQGLIGAFLDYDSDFLVMHGYLSYLVYPENIPNVVIDDGHFQPRHPQAISSIPETVTVLGQNAPLYYEIEYPAASEFLFRPGMMMEVESHARDPLLFRALYAYKPINYLNYALRGNLSIPENRVRIYIKPRLLSNQIIAGDLGYRFPGGNTSFGISGIAQVPDPEELDAQYTYAPATNATLISPWLKWSTRDFDGSVSALFWNGGLEPDVGQFAVEGSAVFSSHVFYRTASQVKAGTRVPFLPEGSRVQGRWIHEFALAADWIGGDLFIPIATDLGKMKFTLGADLIQCEADSNQNLGGELLVDLRPLDHVRMGVQFAI